MEIKLNRKINLVSLCTIIFVNKLYFLLNLNCYQYQKLFDYNSNMFRKHEIDIVLECPFNFKQNQYIIYV